MRKIIADRLNKSFACEKHAARNSRKEGLRSARRNAMRDIPFDTNTFSFPLFIALKEKLG